MGEIGKGIDRAIRFEQLETDLAGVLNSIGFAGTVQIPLLNKTPTKPKCYREFYEDAESIEIIEKCFEEDFFRFGYEFWQIQQFSAAQNLSRIILRLLVDETP